MKAHTLSSIGNCDWPDEYPELLNSLIALISSSSSDSVHGAMQVFTEFIKSDLTEDQILPVLRQLLPVLLTILGSIEVRPAFFVNQFRLDDWGLATYTSDSRPNRVRISSMRDGTLHGQRSTSTSSEGSDCNYSTSLARGFQSPP